MIDRRHPISSSNGTLWRWPYPIFSEAYLQTVVYKIDLFPRIADNILDYHRSISFRLYIFSRDRQCSLGSLPTIKFSRLTIGEFFLTLAMTPFLWLTALSYFSATYALDYYVSPTGSDNNSGTVGSPFLTLSKAQTAVRAAVVNTQAENITVHIADGVYILSDPLLFTAEDSGKNGYTVSWSASGTSALISGGTELTGWALNSTTGIYSTTVPVGTTSRHLYVGGSAAQYARTELARSSFTFDNTTIKWTSTANDWLASLLGIENAEIRAINSFTDRYSPIGSASAGQLLMDQPAWVNNIWGYDTISDPYADEGFYIQNALSLLTEANEYFLDSHTGQIYYKPLDGEDMETISTYLGRLETLIAIGGTYDTPAYDIAFQGLNFVSHLDFSY